jgi:hypothetical protein
LWHKMRRCLRNRGPPFYPWRVLCLSNQKFFIWSPITTHWPKMGVCSHILVLSKQESK